MMVESVDTADLKFAARKGVRVRVPLIPSIWPLFQGLFLSLSACGCHLVVKGESFLGYADSDRSAIASTARTAAEVEDQTDDEQLHDYIVARRR